MWGGRLPRKSDNSISGRSSCAIRAGIPCCRKGEECDRIDARRLADFLCTNVLLPGYHGQNGVRTRTLKELAGNYLTVSKGVVPSGPE